MKNPVVILDVTYGGYGVVKALSKYNVPMIGMVKESERLHPEANTRLCEIQTYVDSKELLALLNTIANSYSEPPVLILTSDYQVEFFMQYRPWIETRFLTNMPDSETIGNLLYKNRFQKLAEAKGWNVPSTQIISSMDDFDTLKYPCFIKPQMKWNNAYKGFMCKSKEDAIPLWELGDTLLAQEWIPGSTEDIYTVYVYHDQNKQCRTLVTTRKVREWPPEAGTACCIEIVKDESLECIANEFFQEVGYKGFGSLELKQHSQSGEFYIIEATVGRIDANSGITNINGFNLPALHYSVLTGEILDDVLKQKRPRYWIHELMDFQSSLEEIKKHPMRAFNIFWTYLRSEFHLFNMYDMLPFWLFFKDKVLKIR